MDEGCGYCGGGLKLARAGARFCSTKCRVYWHRAVKALPLDMTARDAWTRADGKRPVTVSGAPASSTDSRTWSSYSAVKMSKAGDGYGVMLGKGLGCWDFDHCIVGGVLDPGIRELIAEIPDQVWVERSVSKTGLHVFVVTGERPGRRVPGVEFYSRGRFIRVTADRFFL